MQPIFSNSFYNHLIDALGWTFLHSLWQFSVLFLIAYLLNNSKFLVNSNQKYWVNNLLLWMAPIAALLTFVLYISDYQIITTNINITLTDPIAFENNPSTKNIFSIDESISQWIPALVYVWIIGTFIYFVHLVFGFYYIKKLKSSCLYLIDDSILAIFNNIKSKLGIQKQIFIFESALIDTPMMIGFFKPFILLPIGLANQLSLNEIEAILAHEIAHFKRNDYLFNLIQLLVESIFYYHPAIWWISNKIRMEREHCCDDIALSICKNEVLYAKSLYQILQIKSADNQSIAMALVGSKKHELLNRIKRILNHTQNRNTMVEKISVTGIVLALGIAISVSAYLPNSKNNFTSDQQNLNIGMDQDTTPKVVSKTKEVRILEENDKKIEVTKEDDEIKELKINGNIISPNDYGKYENEIQIAFNPPPPPPPPSPEDPSLPAPPSPPSPPTPPNVREKKMLIITDVKKTDKNFDKEMKKHDEAMKQLDEDMKQHEIAMKRHDEAMKHHDEAMKHHDEAMNKMNAEMDRNEIAQKSEKKMTEAIENELNKDGFLKNSKSFSFDLSKDKLLINKEKQSDAIQKKYRKIYEKETGRDMKNDNHIIIQKQID